MAVAALKLSVITSPKLENLIAQTLLEARMSLIFPEELTKGILAGAERAFKASYASKGTIIVHREEEDSREDIDKMVMQLLKEREAKEDEEDRTLRK
jgi:hypothetical protein